MNRCIITYAEGPHEELLDISLPTYKKFADKHKYDLIVGKKVCNLLSAWNKIPLLYDALNHFDEVVWFDADLIVVDYSEDFPSINQLGSNEFSTDNTIKLFAMVRHFEEASEVPNSGVWRLRKDIKTQELLENIMSLEVFHNHGWWEQAALLTLMGYTVPPQGSHFPATKCRCVQKTQWYNYCKFMRLCWNCHPNYRSNNPKIVHCSYPSMTQRLEVMRELVKNPTYNYPNYNTCEYCRHGIEDK